MLSGSRAILLVYYVVIITVAAAAHLDPDFPIPPKQCEISIRVDPAKDNNWLEEYTQYLDQSIDREAQDHTLNLTCNELQEALLAIHSTIFHKSNSCIEVIISRGTYYITESIEIAQNVHIHGERAGGGVFVEFNVNAQKNVSFFNVMTFLNADHVEITGIEFSNSPGIIAIENVTLVRVSDCSFWWFSRGALDIYQCFIVTVTNCGFKDNGFVGVTKFGYQYRGHAGGLSVGFDDNHYSSNGTNPDSVPDIRGLLVSGCTFRNNTSVPQAEQVSTSRLLQAFYFPGRGGAIAITINSSFTFNASIENCVIQSSFATSFGGGIYLVYSGYAAHTTSIDRTMFVNNRCDGPSGGLQSGFVEGGGSGFSIRLEVYNSEFYDNEAEFGGGIHLFSNWSAVEDGGVQLNNVAHIENCTFMRNSAAEYGAAICFSSLLFLLDSSNVQPLNIVDCTFIDNNGGRAGVLSTAYLPLAFYGQNKFYHNRGRVLVISGTHADIYGLMHFQSNDGSAVDAGALYVTSFGHLQLYNGARMMFENNTGILGASIIVVSIASLSESYSNLLYNPLCVLRSENSTDRPQDWQNVSIKFTGNEALFGSTVLLNDVNLCSWTSLGPVFFNNSEVFRWDFVEFLEDNINKAHSPEQTNPLWYVQTPAKKIFLTGADNVTAYPGQAFSLNVTGVDQLGLSTPVAISLSEVQMGYAFNPSAAAPGLIKMPSINTTFTTSRHTVEDLRDMKPTNISVSTIFTQSALSLSFTFTPEVCHAGYVLTHTRDRNQHFCDCNEENNTQIIQCDNQRIFLSEGQWGIQSELTGANDLLVTYSCPPRYCQCFEFSKTTFMKCNFVFDPEFPDKQCHCSRKGELCGDCKNETAGFTALLDRCETCGYVNGLLIVALLVVDAIVIGMLLLVKSSPCSWLYPALFYLQAVPYLALYFPATFEIFHSSVYYVSSALSFYFVYDFCLGPQFSAISAYFIRFIPFLVSVAVTIPVIVFRYRYNLNNRPWPGLWWVVLFQYTHVVYTCVSILNCPMLPGDDGLISPRWFVNGNITCFTGFHIPLALFACVVLLFCVSIIPIILLYTLGYLKRPSWLSNSVLAATSTFKQNSSCWCAVELARRLLLVLFIVAFPRNDYPAIFCLMITVGLFMLIQPFKAMSANVVEAFLAADLLVLLLLRQTDKALGYNNSIPELSHESKSNTTNISQNGEECYDSSISGISIQASLLIPGYYIPLVVFILACCVSAILKIRSNYLLRRRASSDGTPNEVEDHNNQSDNHQVNHPPPTMIVELSSSQQVPLSRLWNRIIGLRRNSDRTNTEVRASEYGQWNSLDRQRHAVNMNGSRQRVTIDNEIRQRTQSTPAGVMKIQRYHDNALDTVREASEHVELKQELDNVLNSASVEKDDSV